MERWLIANSMLLWIILALNLLLTLALIQRLPGKKSSQHGLKSGTPAPSFTASTLAGEETTQRSFAGHDVALLFVSPTCGPCRQMLPDLESLHPEAQRAGTEFVLVSLANAEKTGQLINEFDIRMPVLIAPAESNSLSKDYNISATPSFCLVDRKGIVQAAGILGPSGPWAKLAEGWRAEGKRRELVLS